jgi:hypothetical protein
MGCRGGSMCAVLVRVVILILYAASIGSGLVCIQLRILIFFAGTDPEDS